MHHSRLKIMSQARWVVRDCMQTCGAFPRKYNPGCYGPDVYQHMEFHSRCLPLDWAYKALCTSTNLYRCQNGSLSTPDLTILSKHRTIECPRCQGVGEIPVFDTTEWAVFVEEHRRYKAQGPNARPLRDPPQPVEVQLCTSVKDSK